MPFITPVQNPNTSQKIYVLSGEKGTKALAETTFHFAKHFLESQKKVLVFDALLGLKNLPIHLNNAEKIANVLAGVLPLTELIQNENGVDIIAGESTTNLNALSSAAQRKIKADLLLLSKAYDVLIICCPAQVLSPVFKEGMPIYWVSAPDKESLLKTLRLAGKNPPIRLILSPQQSTQNPAFTPLFIKSLCPQAEIITFFK